MQARRPSAVPPLAIVLPHPSLPRRRSSLLSTSTPPRTPRSCGSPTCSSIFFTSSNRKSTDSWNSSNQDEQEWEWKQEQTLLLSRTLDALPAHLITPFHGAVPPSNLLDKIARGVAQAKGPLDWPHSIRATRAKLVELARVRAKEERIAEEDAPEVLQPTTNTGATTRSPLKKRPLYRQSSMDFMSSAKIDLKDNDNISRLSNRLQRTDRIIPNPAYHPYLRPSRPSATTTTESPRTRSPSPSFLPLNPSTPSSTTLNSSMDSSSSSAAHRLHRTLSAASSNSSAMDVAPYFLANPRVQRIRRSDSLCVPPLAATNARPLKRAPSYGSTSNSSLSDEEERVRTQHAKKARTKSASPPPSSPVEPSPVKSTKAKTKTKVGSTSSKSSSKSGSGSSSSGRSITTQATSVYSSNSAQKTSSPRPRANLQRNPSIFGPELPALPQPPPTPAPNLNAQMRSPRPLRRMHATSFARAPARRISFGGLVGSGDEADAFAEAFGGALPQSGAEPGLGSAFQLQ